MPKKNHSGYTNGLSHTGPSLKPVPFGTTSIQIILTRKCATLIETLQVVLLGNGKRQKADVAQRRGPVVRAQVDQAQLRGRLRVGEGQHCDQQEAHCHHKLEEKRNDRASVSLLSITES